MDILLSVMIGLCLAACCGFRVFVPLLVLSIATRAGWVSMDPSLAWVGGTPALIVLSVATLAEVLAYKVPWVDHALDTIATPAAVVAGTLVAGSQWTFIGGNGSMLKWACAAIAGGGVAAGVQTVTVTARAASTALTGGLGNPVVATAESASAVVFSILSVLAPLLATVLLVGVIVLAALLIRRWLRRRDAARATVTVPVSPVPIRS